MALGSDQWRVVKLVLREALITSAVGMKHVGLNGRRSKALYAFL